jgi:hypothetical protein
MFADFVEELQRRDARRRQSFAGQADGSDRDCRASQKSLMIGVS